MNNTDKSALAQQVLLWWEDAQYWESRSGRNMFDEEPDFVLEAMRLTKSSNGTLLLISPELFAELTDHDSIDE